MGRWPEPTWLLLCSYPEPDYWYIVSIDWPLPSRGLVRSLLHGLPPDLFYGRYWGLNLLHENQVLYHWATALPLFLGICHLSFLIKSQSRLTSCQPDVCPTHWHSTHIPPVAALPVMASNGRCNFTHSIASCSLFSSSALLTFLESSSFDCCAAAGGTRLRVSYGTP